MAEFDDEARHQHQVSNADPNVSWQLLVAALDRGDRLNAMEHAEALLEWLDQGGFPPETGAVQPQFCDEEWNEAICRAVCELLWNFKSRTD